MDYLNLKGENNISCTPCTSFIPTQWTCYSWIYIPWYFSIFNLCLLFLNLNISHPFCCVFKKKKKTLGPFPNIKHILKVSSQTIFSPPPWPARLLFLDQYILGKKAKLQNHRQVGSWSSPPITPLDSSSSTATAASATGVQGDMGGVSWSTERPA